MLKEYFESYRASALCDLLPEFTQEAKLIPLFNYTTSVYHYLQDVTLHIKDAIAAGNKPLFLDMLKEHQAACIEVQKSVVSKYESPLKYGWKSFKFSDVEVQYDRFTLVPRVGINVITNKPVVYAEEMKFVTDNNADKVLETKSRKPCWVKVLPNGSFVSIDLSSINEREVRDWTAELKV